MDKISELEQELDMSKEYHKDPITKEEMDWVEKELEEVDKLYNEMYRKDV